MILKLKKSRKKVINEYIYQLIICLLIVIICFIISKNFLQVALIQGESMQPSYHHMQIVIIDKTFEKVTSGDVIAFKSDNVKGSLIKRVVATPGQTVVIENGILYIDNKNAMLPFYGDCIEYEGVASREIYLDEEQFFVIGDNCNYSKDSRYEEIGLVTLDDIIGIVYP